MREAIARAWPEAYRRQAEGPPRRGFWRAAADPTSSPPLVNLAFKAQV